LRTGLPVEALLQGGRGPDGGSTRPSGPRSTPQAAT